MNKKQIGHGHGYGKTILFGEHFVVHGLPSIVAALQGKTDATVEKLENAEKPFDFTLPYSGLFTQPLVQFKNGTKISEAIKKICQIFKLVFLMRFNR